MKLDYGTLLCPDPITLSIGTILQPKLKEIRAITFDLFNYFEILATLTPEFYYIYFKGEEGKKYWNSLPQDEQDSLELYYIIIHDNTLIESYLQMLNFFFKETIIFGEDFFILLNDGVNKTDVKEIDLEEDIHGLIHKDNFLSVLNLIQQVCYINDDSEDIKDVKYKNDVAKKIHEKILKGKKKERESKKANPDLILANIISAISNKHPTISPLNVWELTVFQLMDSFNRSRINAIYDIDSTRVAVWGDEKKTFDVALWYKNERKDK